MSDMASGRITIRIPETLGQRLRHRSRLKGLSESVLIREALETYLSQSTEPRLAFDLAEEAGLIGCIGLALALAPQEVGIGLAILLAGIAFRSLRLGAIRRGGEERE